MPTKTSTTNKAVDEKESGVTTKTRKTRSAPKKREYRLHDTIVSNVENDETLTAQEQVRLLKMLEAMVPESWFGVRDDKDDESDGTYVSRRFEGVSDIELLRYAREQLQNSVIFGPTGPGKTSAVMAYCATDLLPFASMPCNGGADVGQMVGRWVPASDGEFTWQDGLMVTFMKYGGVYLFNEVNFMPARTLSATYGVLDKRRNIALVDKDGSIIQASPMFQAVADYNPDYEGTRPLNAAFKNRFALKMEFDYDPAIEAELVVAPTMLEVAAKVRHLHSQGDVETPFSPNMMMEHDQIVEDFIERLGAEAAVRLASRNLVNAFDSDEQEAVRKIVELSSEALAEEYSIAYLGEADPNADAELDEEELANQIRNDEF